MRNETTGPNASDQYAGNWCDDFFACYSKLGLDLEQLSHISRHMADQCNEKAKEYLTFSDVSTDCFNRVDAFMKKNAVAPEKKKD